MQGFCTKHEMGMPSNMCKGKATLVKKVALLLSAVCSVTDEKSKLRGGCIYAMLIFSIDE